MNKIPWNKLNITRASILNIKNARELTATNNYNEQFMIAFGSDRHGGKIVFIDIDRNEHYIYLCDTEFQAEQIATSIVYKLLEYSIDDILDEYDFEEVN